MCASDPCFVDYDGDDCSWYAALLENYCDEYGRCSGYPEEEEEEDEEKIAATDEYTFLSICRYGEAIMTGEDEDIPAPTAMDHCCVCADF